MALASSLPDRNSSHIIESWFTTRGWSPFDYQRDAWRAYLDGRSGLVHAPTGVGKTLAVWLGPVIEAMNERKPLAGARGSYEPLRVLWITPMRALATDTEKSLLAPVTDLGLHWSIDKRTGDTPASRKLKQRERLPTALVTTPESLSLLLSYPNARELFATLRCVVVDEWHELLSTKRGTQTELCLARLRAWNPSLRTWGLSATLGNLDRAMQTLIPDREPLLIRGPYQKRISIRTILPASVERFPWAGHLGLRLLESVLEEIAAARSSLLFTNTRSQAELWFRAIVEARPDWLGRVAIHHGSLDRDLRARVEECLRKGAMQCVVCTSSLDLGVDFSPVDRVIQVGSPKGVARLLQRAGRSGHQPGAVSEIIGVPTNALELVEFAAARDAADARAVEPREPLDKPLDVLVQHLVTVGLGGGFEESAMFDEIRSAHAYRDLSRDEWNWCIDFVTRGGPSLHVYPQYARVAHDNGTLRVLSRAVERLHRMSIGTITTDGAMTVRYLRGKSLGTIEEGFVSRLSPGDRFVFAGRPLELVRVREMTAFVTRARTLRGAVPRWDGGRSPLSTQLSHAVRAKIATREQDPSAEMQAVAPLLRLQSEWSRAPAGDELLIESLETNEGFHIFLYPFEGRLVHEGLGALAAHRLAKRSPRTIQVTANDYGIEFLSADLLPTDERTWRALFSPDHLATDLHACLNSTELTRRQFRDIARVAGLIVPGFPGAAKTARQLQASSELFFDVFTEFDPANRLLVQARREVMEQQLEAGRLATALERLGRQRFAPVALEQLSPLAFPLWAESLRTQQVSSESWTARVKKMAAVLEARARSG